MSETRVPPWPVAHQLELEINTDDGPAATARYVGWLTERLGSVTVVSEHDSFGHGGTAAFPTWTFRGTRNDLMILAIRWLSLNPQGDLDDGVLWGNDVESVLDSIREVQ